MNPEQNTGRNNKNQRRNQWSRNKENNTENQWIKKLVIWKDKQDRQTSRSVNQKKERATPNQ